MLFGRDFENRLSRGNQGVAFSDPDIGIGECRGKGGGNTLLIDFEISELSLATFESSSINGATTNEFLYLSPSSNSSCKSRYFDFSIHDRRVKHSVSYTHAKNLDYPR